MGGGTPVLAINCTKGMGLINNRNKIDNEQKKEGARIYKNFEIESILSKMRTSEDVSCVWKDRGYQDHFSVANINFSSSPLFDEDKHSQYIFWISFIESEFVNMSYVDACIVDDKVEKVRVSRYNLSLSNVIDMLEIRKGEEFSRKQRVSISENFLDFYHLIKSLDIVNVDSEILDKKGKVKYAEIEIRESSYFQINRKLYNDVIKKSKNNFSVLKNNVCIFVSIMERAKKYLKKSVFSKNKEAKISQLLPGLNTEKTIPFSSLSYRYVESNVCFVYLKYLAKDIGLSRNTIGQVINSLGEMGVVSFIVLRECYTNYERYFITDSYSERFLEYYVMNRYRSYGMYSIQKIVSIHGSYSQELADN